jgi:hypothetical protein
MALSPNYSWSEPDNSSLVKNGAADIRTLGDAIDTSVWNIGYGQAGKNKLINADFNINQRSFSSSTSTTYTVDRWRYLTVGGTCTASVQTFTLGAAPVAPYEGKNYFRIVTSGQSAASDQTRLQQSIEGVRSLAGQTVTVSFWAKAATGTPKVAIEFDQDFNGGSANVYTTGTNPTLSTSWARYSVTVAIPSISGKTIGGANDQLVFKIFVSAGTDFNARTTSLGIQSNTFEFWGVQIEYGSKATPFQTATGTIQGELAACQRYYWRSTASAAYPYALIGNTSGIGSGANTVSMNLFHPVTMRTNPTAVEYGGTFYVLDGTSGGTGVTLAINVANTFSTNVTATKTGAFTQYRPYWLQAWGDAAAYIGLTAEL